MQLASEPVGCVADSVRGGLSVRAWLGLALVAGCTGTVDPPPSPDTDTAPCVSTDTGPGADCVSAGLLTVGTGTDAFTEHAAGDPWPLERGSQGLQHVMLSLRAPIDPTTLPVPRAALTVSAWRVEDGQAVSTAFTSGWALDPVEGGSEVLGVRVVLPVLDDVLGKVVGFDVRLVPVGASTPWHGWATGVVDFVPGDTDVVEVPAL